VPCGTKLNGLLAAIEAQVSNRPDATIAELRAWLLETHKVSASTGLMNKTLAALDLTFKKGSPAFCVLWLGQAAWRTRARSSLKPARPYMLRFSIFSRLIWPSAGLVVHGRSRAA
jgi:hypothetical protein